MSCITMTQKGESGVFDPPHDGQAVPQGAETLVDVVGFLLPGAGRARSRAAAALAAREVYHPKARVLPFLPHKLDLES